MGEYLRQRYINLIGNNGAYHKDKIYVRSTDVDRCLISAAHALAGMFPPTGNQIWKSNFPWQAIPIHTLPEKDDHILTTKRPCPKYEKLHKAIDASDEMKAVVEKHKELFKRLERLTGKPVQKIGHINILYQTLMIEKDRGFA